MRLASTLLFLFFSYQNLSAQECQGLFHEKSKLEERIENIFSQKHKEYSESLKKKESNEIFFSIQKENALKRNLLANNREQIDSLLMKSDISLESLAFTRPHSVRADNGKEYIFALLDSKPYLFHPKGKKAPIHLTSEPNIGFTANPIKTFQSKEFFFSFSRQSLNVVRLEHKKTENISELIKNQELPRELRSFLMRNIESLQEILSKKHNFNLLDLTNGQVSQARIQETGQALEVLHTSNGSYYFAPPRSINEKNDKYWGKFNFQETTGLKTQADLHIEMSGGVVWQVSGNKVLLSKSNVSIPDIRPEEARNRFEVFLSRSKEILEKYQKSGKVNLTELFDGYFEIAYSSYRGERYLVLNTVSGKDKVFISLDSKDTFFLSEVKTKEHGSNFIFSDSTAVKVRPGIGFQKTKQIQSSMLESPKEILSLLVQKIEFTMAKELGSKQRSLVEELFHAYLEKGQPSRDLVEKISEAGFRNEEMSSIFSIMEMSLESYIKSVN